MRPDREAVAEAITIDHVYTIGSPLGKIGFFWPDLKPERSRIGVHLSLLGKPRTFRRTAGQKLKDLAMLLAETLIASVVLLGLLVCGTALMIAAALLGPFAISLPFRLFFRREIWGPIFFLIVPLIDVGQRFSRLQRNHAGRLIALSD